MQRQSQPSRPVAMARRAALVAVAVAAVGCGKGESPAAPTPATESLQIDDPKLMPAARAMDKVAARLQDLVQRAEAAQGERQQLVALRSEYQSALAQGRLELAALEKAANPADRRTMNAYYLQVVAPLLGRLQPLLFPALLVDLPRGATPAEPATATTAPAKP
ncbi:MAG: hypothetical protein HY902_04145 [Deltaproteobacteria bacterium]|nr:hypothetical protein [Deltaproteobacteria bacterium]